MGALWPMASLDSVGYVRQRAGLRVLPHRAAHPIPFDGGLTGLADISRVRIQLQRFVNRYRLFARLSGDVPFGSLYRWPPGGLLRN
jgi:hypothetical protein